MASLYSHSSSTWGCTWCVNAVPVSYLSGLNCCNHFYGHTPPLGEKLIDVWKGGGITQGDLVFIPACPLVYHTFPHNPIVVTWPPPLPLYVDCHHDAATQHWRVINWHCIVTSCRPLHLLTSTWSLMPQNFMFICHQHQGHALAHNGCVRMEMSPTFSNTGITYLRAEIVL